MEDLCFWLERKDHKLNLVMDWCTWLARHLNAPLSAPMANVYLVMMIRLLLNEHTEIKEAYVENPTG